MITVISAKPMKPDSIPPPEAGDVKAKEKPIKVILYITFVMSYLYHNLYYDNIKH